jgi:hypothetical protein
MALGFYFAPASMTAEKYDECIKRLRKAGAAHPSGRSYHAAFGTPDKLMVFDVWTSQAAFEKFGRTLMPILQDIGVDAGQPQVMDMHNVVVPPAAKKRAPARRAAPKKSAARRRGRGKKR